jgi:hypothetical protein
VRPTVPLWEQARPRRRADQTRPFDREQGGQIENSGRGPVEFWGRRMAEYGVLCTLYITLGPRCPISPFPCFHAGSEIVSRFVCKVDKSHASWGAGPTAKSKQETMMSSFLRPEYRGARTAGLPTERKAPGTACGGAASQAGERDVRWPQTTWGGAARPPFWRWTAGKVPNVSTGLGGPRPGSRPKPCPEGPEVQKHCSPPGVHQQLPASKRAGSRLDKSPTKSAGDLQVHSSAVALAWSYAESPSRPDKTPIPAGERDCAKAGTSYFARIRT